MSLSPVVPDSALAMSIPTTDPIVIAPSPTPFREDDAVDFGAIERNVGRWMETPLSGFVLNSENGEEAFLSESERLEVVQTVCRVANGEKLIVAGIDSPSVTETLRFAESYANAGADLIRVRIPRLTANVKGFFEEVVPRAPAPVVVIHQVAPGLFLSTSARSGASPELIGEIVSMDNVFGYITSDNIRVEARVRELVPAHKKFWTCNGSLLLAGAVMGGNGGCMMFANVAPGECRDIIRLAMEGKLTEAQAIQNRIIEADWQILSRGAAGIKAAMNLLGFEAGVPRSPSEACDGEGVRRIGEALRRAGLVG